MEMLYHWFGDFIVKIENEKKTAFYDSKDKVIHAFLNNRGHIFVGDTSQVKYIYGKLIGLSNSNLEKERRSAEEIQKNIAHRICLFPQDRLALENRIVQRLSLLNEEQQARLHSDMLSFAKGTALAYEQKSEEEKNFELYPFDIEVFEGILENTVYQLTQPDRKGFTNAWMWLLLGSTLRNACGRLLHYYDSSFTPLCQVPTESGTLSERIEYMMHPESFESYYLGENHGERFPGIQWYCDKCDSILNNQTGFDDHLPAWQCRQCGHINFLSETEIFSSKEAFRIHNKTK